MHNHRPNMESKKTLNNKIINSESSHCKEANKSRTSAPLTHLHETTAWLFKWQWPLLLTRIYDHVCVCVCVREGERKRRRKQKWILLDEYHYLISLWSLQKKEIVKLALSYSQTTNKNYQTLKNQNYKRRNFSFKKGSLVWTSFYHHIKYRRDPVCVLRIFRINLVFIYLFIFVYPIFITNTKI